MQGNLNSYFDDEFIDLFVCNTTGRYGPEDSYTRATRQYLSVDIGAGGGGTCGYQRSFVVSVGFEGVGYKLFGDGNYYPVETVIVGENYACTVSQCFDGSAAVVTMTLRENDFNPDDTCGGAGNFDPCKFTTPQVTVVVAP
jgi:hypothetical protein